MSSAEKDTRTRILETTWSLLEAHPGRSLSMSEIAKASGVSRQALYLHFASRAELLITTIHYVDKVKGLDQRLQTVQQSKSGIEMLQSFINMWGNYMPEVYGVSKALMMSKNCDEDAEAAWSQITGCLYDVCSEIIQKLDKEHKLSSDWNQQSASDFLWTITSIQNWEQLTMACGWSNDQYISHITHALIVSLVSD